MNKGNEKPWPGEGLEVYVRYTSRFNHLNINLGSDKACSEYFSTWMARYRKIMRNWSEVEAAVWSVRMRQSLKSTFVSTHFSISANEAYRIGSYVTFYYLSYYAALHALWGVLYLHSDEKTDAISKPTHTKIYNVFQSSFCGPKGIIRYQVKEMMEDLRTRREYYSYRMPMNSPFDDHADARGETASVGGLVKQCIQLSNLHSHLISEASTRENIFSGTVPREEIGSFIDAFRTINSQRHPKREGWFLEPADEKSLNEFITNGWELYGHSVMFDHMVDEFMSYPNGGASDLSKARTVWSLVHQAFY